MNDNSHGSRTFNCSLACASAPHTRGRLRAGLVEQYIISWLERATRKPLTTRRWGSQLGSDSKFDKVRLNPRDDAPSLGHMPRGIGKFAISRFLCSPIGPQAQRADYSNPIKALHTWRLGTTAFLFPISRYHSDVGSSGRQTIIEVRSGNAAPKQTLANFYFPQTRTSENTHFRFSVRGSRRVRSRRRN